MKDPADLHTPELPGLPPPAPARSALLEALDAVNAKLVAGAAQPEDLDRVLAEIDKRLSA